MIHTRRAGGGTVVYDARDWPAGLAPQGRFTGTTIGVRNNGVPGASRITNIDPFFRYGILAPGQASSANATNSGSLGGVVVAGELTDNSTLIGVDTAGKIQQVTTSGTTAVVTTGSFPYIITGTNPVGQDAVLYKHNSGGTTTQVTSAFFSYYNNAKWDVASQVNLSGTPSYDFMTTTPASPLAGDSTDTYQRTMAHPMEIGADDILYVGSGRYLHAYDGATGANGTFYAKVLTLPAGFQITALKKNKDILYVVGNYYSTASLSDTGVALCYPWDYKELDPVTVIPLEDSTVSALFIWKGLPTVITSGAVVGRNGRNKIKVINGNSVSRVADFDGTLPTNRGIVVENEIIYMNCGGLVMSVGDKFIKSYAMNQLGTFSNATASGILFYNSVQSCFTGSTSDGTAFFGNLNAGMGAGTYRTPLFTPDFPVNKQGKLKAIYVEFYQALATAGTNGNLSLVFYTDSQQTTTTMIVTKSEVALPLVKKYSLATNGDNLPIFSGYELLIQWNAGTGTSPTVAKVMVDYDDIDISA